MRRKQKSENKEKLEFEYSGRVTLSVVNKGKVVKKVTGHNSGTYRLFDFISRCLISSYDGQLSPKYLQVFHATGPDDTNLENKDSLVGLIGVSSSSITLDKVNNLSIASLTFTIPGELFSDSTLQPNLFAIYSTSDRLVKTNPLATYYSEAQLTNITSADNVIVVWELIIGNKQ